ncbi:MAG: general secretion pathway protein GspH [Gammaproteobacteria bacterium]|nr:general secretion pathway protein GspH [Gammaproteobacteria bacterium]MBU1415848.1 general secretion pathway protein GspH [Gammaproteobacteria bacterium]
MAIVLFIVALLLGAMVLPLTAQMDARDNGDAQKTLAEIRDALIGYAVSRAGRPYLPCPDTDGDGAEDRAGSACTNAEGDIPWNTLGLGRLDPWNRAYRYRVTPEFSNNTGFLLTTAGDLRVCTDNACGTPVATAIPAVLLSKGKNGAGANANEVENSDDDNDFVSKDPDPNYDDLVLWLSPNILFNRMVAAGRLP